MVPEEINSQTGYKDISTKESTANHDVACSPHISTCALSLHNLKCPASTAFQLLRSIIEFATLDLQLVLQVLSS